MSAQPKSHVSRKRTLEARLAQHPELKTKIESLLSVVENADGDLTQADDAERAVIEEIRTLGKIALSDWAKESHEAAKDRFIQHHPQSHRRGKKNSTGTVD